MPLIYDAEYQEELEKITRKALSGNRQARREHLLATAVTFAGLFGSLIYLGVSDTQLVAAGIGLSTLCLVAVINERSKEPRNTVDRRAIVSPVVR